MNGKLPENLDDFVAWAAPKIQEIHQGVYGVPDTDEKGLVGKCKEHDAEIAKVKRVLYTTIGVLAGSGVLSVGIWGVTN